MLRIFLTAIFIFAALVTVKRERSSSAPTSSAPAPPTSTPSTAPNGANAPQDGSRDARASS